MMRDAFFYGLLGLCLLSPFSGCTSFEKGPAGSYPSDGGTGGAGGAGGNSGAGGNASAEQCANANGTCEVLLEGCDCSDCVNTAFCIADQCVDDGYCTFDDACICDDCKKDGHCADTAQCDEDGVCESFFEGCVCADCANKAECLDNP